VSVVHDFGEGAYLVDTGDADVADALRIAIDEAQVTGLRGVVPGRESLLVEFDPLIADADGLRRMLERGPAGPRAAGTTRHRTIPVVYGGEHGPDLEAVADAAGLTAAAVVELHTATELRALFCGFAPGFAYLGDVAAPLNVPRLATPRTTTPAGSVALADGMSGIYPAELPGGWRVIGRTPRLLFDVRRDPPAYLGPGDLVRFTPLVAMDWDAHAGVAPDW
jgi:5-oxoprolinase (ATP-hydrolysing) subunit B